MSDFPLAALPQSTDSLSGVNMDSTMNVLLYSLSETSKRVYAHTYQLWQDFALSQGLSVYDMRPENLIAFLEHEPLSHSTKKARLSHLRKLLQVLHAAHPDRTVLKSMYEQARLLKVKRSSGTQASTERNKTALARQEVYQAFAVWDDGSKLHTRNRALLAILFYGGLRRSEAAALRWDDIDLETGMIRVLHGKGDKERTIPLLGDESPIQMLREWQTYCAGRTFVFCGMRRGDNLAEDKAMSDQAIYDVVKATGEAISVDFAPHDARRTLLTRGLAAGSSVRDMQFIAGHANPDTTLGYAVVKDAHEVKGRAKLDY